MRAVRTLRLPRASHDEPAAHARAAGMTKRDVEHLCGGFAAPEPVAKVADCGVAWAAFRSDPGGKSRARSCAAAGGAWSVAGAGSSSADGDGPDSRPARLLVARPTRPRARKLEPIKPRGKEHCTKPRAPRRPPGLAPIAAKGALRRLKIRTRCELSLILSADPLTCHVDAPLPTILEVPYLLEVPDW